MTTADSEKNDKKLLNRRFRRVNRQRIGSGDEPIHLRLLYDPWKMDKDGKQFFSTIKYPELLRK